MAAAAAAATGDCGDVVALDGRPNCSATERHRINITATNNSASLLLLCSELLLVTSFPNTFSSDVSGRCEGGDEGVGGAGDGGVCGLFVAFWLRFAALFLRCSWRIAFS